ncbi:hypothetical protein [Halocynthiibacter styelae]|uniref:Flagellar biosynthesis protein n=1 Tax=Halocynthiibacter styelae TaxID=2761955 RepID=A0A8J7J686_9RHOB|nr:hypothetical protein [Paenihalocynthiibacter styelae]MBI1494340.1 hypothetical protein [Paenihalocynthiibacter styelae]
MAPLKLEEFDIQPVRASAPAGAQPAAQDHVQSEEAKLEAFENGYKAGWDDAAKSHAENLDNVSVELARNLQELSFTFHEARAQVLKDMRAVFSELMEKIMPRIAAENLPAMIAEQITEIARSDVNTRIELQVHPANAQSVENLLPAQNSLDVVVVGEASLGEGQARLVFAEGEQIVDLSGVLAAAQEKTEGFFNLNEKVV